MYEDGEDAQKDAALSILSVHRMLLLVASKGIHKSWCPALDSTLANQLGRCRDGQVKRRSKKRCCRK